MSKNITRCKKLDLAVECITEPSMETLARAKFENKNKMADSRFATSNQSNVEQLSKINSKNQNILKATRIWLKVWQKWATARKVNQKVRPRRV